MRVRFEELRTQIIHCLAMVEALIDFGEGEEIEEGVYEQGTIHRVTKNPCLLTCLSSDRSS